MNPIRVPLLVCLYSKEDLYIDIVGQLGVELLIINYTRSCEYCMVYYVIDTLVIYVIIYVIIFLKRFVSVEF